MKLRHIIEAGLSRRDFLKHSTAAAASLSPLGKFLVANGVVPSLAQAAQERTAIPFTVMSNTYYGRGGPPQMSQQFQKVGKAASLVKRLGNITGIGSDEDAYFTGEMSAETYARLQQAANGEEPIRIAGKTFGIFDDGDSLYLEGPDDYIRIFKDELPIWAQGESFTDNPIKAWWNHYGKHGEEPLDAISARVMRELELEPRDHTDKEYIDEVMGETEPEEPEPNWRPEPQASSMHQWFEQKLIKALI